MFFSRQHSQLFLLFCTLFLSTITYASQGDTCLNLPGQWLGSFYFHTDSYSCYWDARSQIALSNGKVQATVALTNGKGTGGATCPSQIVNFDGVCKDSYLKLYDGWDAIKGPLNDNLMNIKSGKIQVLMQKG